MEGAIVITLLVVIGLVGVIWTGKSIRRGFRLTDKRVLDLVLNSTDGRAHHDDVSLAA